MKFSRLIVWVVFLSVFAMSARVAMDNDTWWHLRAGQWMVENRSLMQVDSFSFTRAGTPWAYPGLWVQVLMYVIFNWFGPGGLNLWAAGLVTLTFWVVWKTLPDRGFLAAFAIILAATASSIYWSSRPYLITFLLSAVFLWLLEGYRWRGRKNLWALPVLMVLWVNSHGAFLIGFLMWGCYFAGSLVDWLIAKRQGSLVLESTLKVKHLFVVGILMGIALLINPQGAEILSLPFTTVARKAEQLHIEEWQSPDFTETRMKPFGILLLVTVVVMVGSKRKSAVDEFLLVSGFGFMGLVSARFIPIFAVVAPVILARHAKELILYLGEKLKIKQNIQLDRKPTPIQGWLNRILVLLLALVALLKVATVLPAEENWKVFRQTLPVSAVEFIKTEQPEGRMFNSYDFGGYLIWSLPEYPVFIDGRADLHGDEIIFEWLSIVRGEDGWEDSLDEWEIGFILVEPDMPLVEKLGEEGWKLVYEDDVAVVYTR